MRQDKTPKGGRAGGTRAPPPSRTWRKTRSACIPGDVFLRAATWLSARAAPRVFFFLPMVAHEHTNAGENRRPPARVHDPTLALRYRSPARRVREIALLRLLLALAAGTFLPPGESAPGAPNAMKVWGRLPRATRPQAEEGAARNTTSHSAKKSPRGVSPRSTKREETRSKHFPQGQEGALDLVGRKAHFPVLLLGRRAIQGPRQKSEEAIAAEPWRDPGALERQLANPGLGAQRRVAPPRLPSPDPSRSLGPSPEGGARPWAVTRLRPMREAPRCPPKHDAPLWRPRASARRGERHFPRLSIFSIPLSHTLSLSIPQPSPLPAPYPHQRPKI